MSGERLALIVVRHSHLLQCIQAFHKYLDVVNRPRRHRIRYTPKIEHEIARHSEQINQAVTSLIHLIPGTTGIKLYYEQRALQLALMGYSTHLVMEVFGFRPAKNKYGIFESSCMYIEEAHTLLNVVRDWLRTIYSLLSEVLGLRGENEAAAPYHYLVSLTEVCREQYDRSDLQHCLRYYGAWGSFITAVNELMYYLPWVEDWLNTYRNCEGEDEMQSLYATMCNISVYCLRFEP